MLPPLAAGTGATFLVGGSTAAVGGLLRRGRRAGCRSSSLVVVGLSALLLLLVFRSLLIPLKAALLNLLSVGASLGVITLVFQEGLFGVAHRARSRRTSR